MLETIKNHISKLRFFQINISISKGNPINHNQMFTRIEEKIKEVIYQFAKNEELEAVGIDEEEKAF